MSDMKLEGADYDRWLSQSEVTAHNAVIASNDAFVLAMAKAVKRGREKAVPGTYVDTTPPIGALRIRGDIIMSACGSPAAMCMEGGAQIGAEAMK
jgi:ABC-type sugar transport system substrate-binding protein